MTLWHPDPPQGSTTEQGLVIIGRPVIPKFGAPQGTSQVMPPIVGGWISNLDEQFVDDLGNDVVFEL